MKLRIGFIGLGAMGLSHVRSIRQLCSDKADVSAICATNESSLGNPAKEVPEAKAYKKQSELIDSPRDAIFVSTPNFTHVKLTEKVLAAGKHLFLEKPCGITREECHRLVEVA